jgi:hypothetical protein
MDASLTKFHSRRHEQLRPRLNPGKIGGTEKSIFPPFTDLDTKKRKAAPVLDPDRIVMRGSCLGGTSSELDFQSGNTSLGEDAGKDHSTQ